MTEPIELTTPRLRLRAWREEDKAAMGRINSDPEVMRYSASGTSQADTDQAIERMRGHFAEHGWGFWAGELRQTGELIGFNGVRLERGYPFSPCIEAGWRLARPHWGRGYASEAARACRDFAFRLLGADEVIAVTSLVNLASQALMRRVGMQCDPAREFDHPRVPQGHPLRRHCLFAISPEQWMATQGGCS